MLATETRQVAVELLQPPTGFRLDLAVLTTYSLDLEVLLALPLAALSKADESLDALLANPLLLLEALREAGSKIHLFVDHGGIAIPRSPRPVYSMLETSVHLARAPGGGAFHPKVWVARFVDADKTVLIRVAVLSRNLTFDRSWDVVLSSEAEPEPQRKDAQTEPLALFLASLPSLTIEGLPAQVIDQVNNLANEVKSCSFSAPKGFRGGISFHALGLDPSSNETWRPITDSFDRLVAVAPFANVAALSALVKDAKGECSLVSRQMALDAISEKALSQWGSVSVMTAASEAEPEDLDAFRPSGLHAKIIGIETGARVTWYIGSANLTQAAFGGKNVELMASITGLVKSSHGAGNGIDAFMGAGFQRLCEPYRRIEAVQDSEAEALAKEQESIWNRLLSLQGLSLRCEPADQGWRLSLACEVEVPDRFKVSFRPVSIPGARAASLPGALRWAVSVAELTCFIAVQIEDPPGRVKAITGVLMLPCSGLPDDRMHHVLRSLIDTPERFLLFLRALLGGIEGLGSMLQRHADKSQRSTWEAHLLSGSHTENLLRVASRNPDKLKPVQALLDDLSKSPDSHEVVPAGLAEILQAVQLALDKTNH